MKITLPFLKMHGLGNDFVVVDGRCCDISALTPSKIRALSHRTMGIGCDQFIVLTPSSQADVTMTIINADGGEVAACGNATRCVAHLIMDERMVDRSIIETKSGFLHAKRTSNGFIAVDMGPARWNWREIPMSHDMDTSSILIQNLQGMAVNVGNPHCVFWTKDVATAPVTTLGPLIEQDPLFPERTNVEWAQILDRKNLKMRVWERGVGETSACGTGACAVVLCAHKAGLIDAHATVAMTGGSLNIDILDNGHVVMSGPATVSFRGEITL